MLTIRERQKLEEAIYTIAKKYLTEGGKKKNKGKKLTRKKDIGLLTKTKRNTLLTKIDNDTVNKAGIAYKLYNSHTKADKDADRSLFYKKLHNEKNDNGTTYKFSDKELNKIESIIDKE